MPFLPILTLIANWLHYALEIYQQTCLKAVEIALENLSGSSNQRRIINELYTR